ncbi:TetR family transcriptional regulator [Nocardia fusca]|uniref:TetR/AcrR family transcriptional regulator n=1 Tax=Nocardia fusca TaxID=941183 RepID=UPI0037C8DC79
MAHTVNRYDAGVRLPNTNRADRTRARILDAARTTFASRGYHGATIRAVAAVAHIDPAMVLHYFGSKSALFAAAVDVDLGIPDLTAISPSQHGEALVRHFLDRWEGEANGEVAMLLLRSVADDEQAAEQTRRTFTDQVVPTIECVLTHPSEAPVRAGIVMSYLLGLALCRYVLQLPEVPATPRHTLIEQFSPSVQRALHEPLGGGAGTDRE